MKTVTFKSPCHKFWGKPLSELALKEGIPAPKLPLEYSGSWQKYESIEEVRERNDYPSDEEVVKFRNAQKKANAKSKAQAAAVVAAGFIQPTTENDPQMRLEEMADLFYKNIPAALRDADPDAARAQARKSASDALQIAWADDDDE
jgi:hypothetical protein